MEYRLVSKISDERSECISMVFELPIPEYLEWIKDVYENRGGIQGQRDRLTTKSAITIRNRMVEDIASGAVLPPVTVGVCMSEDRYSSIKSDDGSEIIEAIFSGSDEFPLSLIDGMQRTSALREAYEKYPNIDLQQPMRLELWVAKKSNNLLYRMLVLNSGQVPWDIRRQLEVIFQSVTSEIEDQIEGIKILQKDDNSRRHKPMEYQANTLIEMFIAFGSRKEKVDSKEHIAQEFTRLDFTEATNKADLVSLFIRALRLFCRFDSIISSNSRNEVNENIRFSCGQDLMLSQPMRIGFITSLAIKVLGKPGRDTSKQEQMEMMDSLENQFKVFFEKLEAMKKDELIDFIDVDTLNSSLPASKSRIGEHDRKFFKDAFEEFFKSIDDLPSMTQCWRAY